MSGEKEFNKMLPEEYIAFIDALFLTQKKRIVSYAGLGKPEAFDMEYMETSARMNRILRKMGQGDFLADVGIDETATDEAEALSAKYVWVYAYWWNRTHALEALAQSRVGKVAQKKDIEKGAKTLLDLITEKVPESKLHPQFKKLIENLSKKDLGVVTISKEG
jgi:hypothetical protein